MESNDISGNTESKWWKPNHWKTRTRVASASLKGADPAEIRNGWLTLPESQARFQQKQLQERELKIASLYEAQQARALDRVRHSPSNGIGTTPPQPQQPVSHQPGKVRQMFEERRTKAGIDKSYPLQPIQNTERTAPRKTLPNGYTKVSSTTKTSVEKKTVKTQMISSSHSVKKQNISTQKINNNLINGSGDLNHNHELDLSEPKIMPHVNGEIIPTVDEKDNVDNSNNDNNDNMIENETFPEALAPIPTPRSPQPVIEVKRPQRSSPTTAQRPKSPVKSKPAAAATSPPRRVVSENRVPSRENSKPKGAMQRGPVLKNNPVTNSQPSSGSNKSRSAPSAKAAVPAEGGCSVCGRHFAPDRLPKHQEICRKTNTKKRKPFDVLKHRLAGTEAEPFINKLRKGTTSSTKVPQKNLNNNWRQKHEEFIQAIRAAKQVQAHLDAGGKLSDLPPPPPSENPDYVQCPHCKRRFNQSAAERHIPKCANFQFNKSKQPAKRR